MFHPIFVADAIRVSKDSLVVGRELGPQPTPGLGRSPGVPPSRQEIFYCRCAYPPHPRKVVTPKAPHWMGC